MAPERNLEDGPSFYMWNDFRAAKKSRCQ